MRLSGKSGANPLTRSSKSVLVPEDFLSGETKKLPVMNRKLFS